ncbi:ABC transporter ATP-binding protein [Atopobacter sp. AH10]|uniref:ABC transporter ATP-binding protein n=1 Tax=Atopobacter sp. AH10 TaxID=2315861 RepID=UPI000EF26CEB|nr:ABC transporter ATP-binding protein [Atopobacter sp. AH10]RLK62727.1 ABC transporter ATP-binding protein [Atopobacter sp. AH10]
MYLRVEGLNKVIKGRTVLEDVNLSFMPNKIYGLIGDNGAGKTTFFRTVLGLTKYSGKFYIDGIEESNYRNDGFFKRVGVVMPFPKAYEKCTIQEIFEEHCFYMGIPEINRISSFLSRLGLNTNLNAKISDLSLGMKQKLNIALALSHRPDLLLLDEPFNGLDRTGIYNLKKVMNDFKQNNKIVIISSHSFRELEDIIDEVIVLDSGKIIASEDVNLFPEKGINSLDEFFEMMKGGEDDE